MKFLLLNLPLLALLLFGVSVFAQNNPRKVIINGVKMDEATLQQLDMVAKIRIADGDYWYDRTSGAWGLTGGHCLGFTYANMNLGGPLSPKASAGNTGIFINGRQLHTLDVQGLNTLFQPFGTSCQPGRYWADSYGNFGAEGNPYPMGNFMQMAQAIRQKGNGYYKNNVTSGAYSSFGSDGNGFGYFGSKDIDGNQSSVYTNPDGSVEIFYDKKID
ncbi:MAG: hypothetical protein SF052_07310 [Bacteroidia bacterium]|nr:hypothetical protein [Bacteroidia bacterium]